MSQHEIIRMRHELRRRKLTVASVTELTPRMLRLGFVSNELGDFASPSADDHIKLFVPSARAEQNESAGLVMRDFTPRAFDPQAGTFVLDFALHERGPAVEWARQARPGDEVEIAGPRGSSVVPDDFDWYLLIGDETALPSIGRRVENLRPAVPVITVVVVADQAEVQSFSSSAAWKPSWVFRNVQSETDAKRLRSALDDLEFSSGDGFVWIAAENLVARDLYTYLIEARHHPKHWIKAAGYWGSGEPDSGKSIA